VPRLPAVVAAALAAYALLATPLLDEMRATWRARRDDYGTARVQLAFGGLPIDTMQAALDASLPRDAGVALSPAILEEAFLRQRLTEGLYPRRIEPRSPYRLDLVASPGPADRVLGRHGGALVVFRGPLAAWRTGDPPTSRPGWWLCVLAATASAAGLGWLVVALAGLRVSPVVAAPSLALLAGIVTIAVLTSAATWLQLPLAGLPLGLAGLVAGRVAARRLPLRRGWPAFRTGIGAAAGRPENWLFLAVLLGVCARVAILPVTLWDGRSVWLFRAHQVREAGRFALVDALHPEYATWTHPAYPLLLPAWLAHATAFSGGWNERAAGLGIAVLCAAVLPLVWALARARLGRWLGAALVLTVFGSVASLTVGAYADGVLVMLLVLALLALVEPATERLGWLAAAAASLTKLEGLVLGAAVALACITFLPAFRVRGPVRRLLPLAVFGPAIAHLLWASMHGVPLEYAGTSVRAAGADLAARVQIVVGQTMALLRTEGYTRCHALPWVGAVAALVSGVWCLAATVPDELMRIALGLAWVSVAFALCVLVASPFDPGWQAGTAADRLLLHPAAFALLAALAAVAHAARRA
jgi:hypothetical protein